MLKKMLVSVVAVAAMSAPLSYGFGLPKMPAAVGGASGGASAADVDTFLAQGAISSELFNKAQAQIAYALASKEQKDKLKSLLEQQKTAIAAKDSKATDATKAFNDEAASIIKNTSDAEAQENLKNLSADQVSSAAKSVKNLALAVMMQKEQIATGQSLVQSATGNLALATKLVALKESITTLGSNISMGANYVTRLPSLFKSAGISVTLPTDTSSKPEDSSLDFQ